MASCCEIVAQLASGIVHSSVYYGMQDKPVSQGLYPMGTRLCFLPPYGI